MSPCSSGTTPSTPGRWTVGRGTPDRWRQDEAELLHYPRYQRIGSLDDRYYATRYAERSGPRTARWTLLKRLKDEAGTTVGDLPRDHEEVSRNATSGSTTVSGPVRKHVHSS